MLNRIKTWVIYNQRKFKYNKRERYNMINKLRKALNVTMLLTIIISFSFITSVFAGTASSTPNPDTSTDVTTDSAITIEQADQEDKPKEKKEKSDLNADTKEEIETTTNDAIEILEDLQMIDYTDTVLNEVTKEPIENVNVTVIGDDGTVYSAITNQDGVFELSIPQGKYRFIFEKDGFETINVTKNIK